MRPLPAFVILIVALTTDTFAQKITSLHPRSIQPGTTTSVMLSGSGLDQPLRAIASVDAEIKIESEAADKALLQLSLAPGTPPGPLAISIVGTAGLAESIVLLVDELPAIAEATDNHSIPNAQPIESWSAVTGTSNGSKSDFFRFHADQGQRIAFEVLTQAIQSSMDPVTRLLDASGSQLLTCDDDEVGPECRFSHTFDRAGDYVLEIRDSRFAPGGQYHLRVGDFPLLRHCFPMAVKRNNETTIEFETIDGSAAAAIEVSLDESAPSSINLAGKLPTGRSSSWARVAVFDIAQRIEPEDSSDEWSLPSGINGRLSANGESDTFALRGKKNLTFRFMGRTRSLGSAALLKMRLLNSAGKQVAQSPVDDSDEWSFDYTFLDDEQYQLIVTDLVGRGGTGFGYHVDISPTPPFEIGLQPDAKTKDQFAIVTGSGACSIDLQINRIGYQGPIELSIENPDLKILNPLIPAKATTATIYVAATDGWNPQSLTRLQLIGTATEDATRKAVATRTGLARIKRPHVPFPAAFDDTIATLAGSPPPADYFTLQAQDLIQFARPTKSHSMTLELKRTNKEFKSALTFLPFLLPEGVTASVKADKDIYTTTLTRRPTVDLIDTIPMSFYSEFQGQGRISTMEFPVAWIDPITVELQSSEPLIAGQTNSIRAIVRRGGNDPQPATLELTGLPEGWRAPENIEIGDGASEVMFDLEIPALAADQRPHEFSIAFQVKSKYRGEDFVIDADWSPPKIIALPTSLIAEPDQLVLSAAGAKRQLIVTGVDSQQRPRDWTHAVKYKSADPTIAEVNQGMVIAKTNGKTIITIEIGDKQTTIPVTVTGAQHPRLIGFESEVLVALSKQGCNSGACHGSPSGKGMFRLSLRAFDKQLDELTLIREDFGRRVNRIDPEQSLLLLKPLMKISHGGGKQIHREDPAFQVIRDWIAQGAKADPPDTPRCDRLETFPSEKRMLSLDGTQQLSVLARFSDGTARDVTDLVAYESSNVNVAVVDDRGLVTPVSRGEAVILVRFLEHIESVPILIVDQDPNFKFQAPTPNNYIDELVNAKLAQLQYLPSPTCNDSEFVRRVYLDVIGILPTLEESREFLDDDSEDKRSRLIDQLLTRDEFAKFWALKWGDLLRMTDKAVGNEGVYKYHRWVEDAMRANLPYDKFATELLSASGSTLANPPANFYRTATDMNECVETVSQVFLGARLQCAKCHNHPFERWTQDNYYGLGAFFNQVARRNTQRPGEMFVYTSTDDEVIQPRTGQKMKPWLPTLGYQDLPADTDPRDAFVQWLVTPDNPYFARIEANRIWSQCFSRGIVDPIDDFRASNPPSNRPLLDALAKDFAASGFDRVHLIRTILNSKTYQAGYQTDASNQDDKEYFSHQHPRLLSAEQLLDAVNHTTGVTDTFGGLPAGTKATHLPAPDLVKLDFLKIFGQSERSTVCACERAQDSNLGMAIELLNGPTVHKKLQDPNNRFRKQIASGKSPREVISTLYMSALCRDPAPAEMDAALAHCEKRDQVADAIEDIYWALINTDEFLFQH